MTLPRLYYQAVADRLARQLRASLGSSYEPTIVTQTATVLNAREIAIAGQRYPLDTSGLAVVPGSSLVVTNIGRLAAARFAPAQTSGSFAISGGAQISPGAIPFGSITADMINVNMLSALAANMGYLNAGSIVIGTDNRLWLNDANDGGLAIGGNAKAAAPFSVDKYGAAILKLACVGDPAALHLYASPTLLEFRSGDTALTGFDAQGRTIYGFERMGPPHGPAIEMAEFTDETGETRYKWQILGENGVPGISFVTGNATDPDDYRIMFGPEGATYYMKFLSGVLTLAASVIILGGSIDKPLTLGLEGGIYQGSGTFAAPTTGLKLWNASGQGKLFTFAGGVEQAGFDTDGKFKGAGGDVVINQYGILLDDVNGKFNGKSIFWVADPTADPSGQTEHLAIGTIVDLGSVTGAKIKSYWALHLESDQEGIYLIPAAGTNINLQNTPRITGLGDATADADALNRQTGDARYTAQIATQSVAGNTTLDATYSDVLVTAAATITLPAAAGYTKHPFCIIHNIAAGGTVTVAPNGAETISGETSQTITARYNAMQLISDGSNWFIR